MADTTKLPLVSSEIAGLWNAYISDTMIVCILNYFLISVEDSETRDLLQQTSDLSTKHIQELTNIFNQEKLTIPEGFTESDVNLNAPRLFTDHFYLAYLCFLARGSMHNFTLTLNLISRSDLRTYFSNRVSDSINLYNTSTNIKLSQGTYIKAPRVEVAEGIHYVENQSFMIDWFGEKRSLLAIEISHIFSIIYSNYVGRAISTAFGQVSKNEKVSDYLFEGKDMATKYISELSSLLTNEGIPIPSSSDCFVTSSTASPFSDKLMMNHSALLSSSGISSLGTAMSFTMRSDLEAKYIKYSAEVMKYSKRGADIMIDNRWLEQSPQSVNHENLTEI